MNFKIVIRLIFDLFILVAMVLLFNKRAFGMAYHEIAGLVLFVLFLVHIYTNRRWVSGITSKIAKASLPAKTVVSWILFATMLVCFIVVGISGIAISRVVFAFDSSWPVWKILHKTGAAITLVLVGVHLGLHHALISSVLRQWFSAPEHKASVLHRLKLAAPLVNLGAKTRKVLLCAFIACVLGFGTYSFATTPFFRWISLPFVARKPKVPVAPVADISATATATREMPAAPPAKKKDTPGIATAAKTLGQFISMALLVATLTAFIDVMLGKRRRP